MNAKIEKVLNLPGYQKILVAFLSCMLIFGLFWLMVYRPMAETRDQLLRQKASLARKLAEDRRIAANLPKFRAEYEKLDSVRPETPVFVRRGHSDGKTKARSARFRTC